MKRLSAEFTDEEKPCIVSKKQHIYSSYKGEITPAAPDLIKRNFHAGSPNKKWLTDITQMIIPAGKIYVSAIVDCFEDLIVSWKAENRSAASVVNRILDKAVRTLNGESPIIHSDCECHYLWTGRLAYIKNTHFTGLCQRRAVHRRIPPVKGVMGAIKE